MPRPAGPPRDHDRIRDVSEHVYRQKIGQRAIANHIRELGEVDGNAKIRSLAASYDGTTVCYMRAFGIEIPTVAKGADTELPLELNFD